MIDQEIQNLRTEQLDQLKIGVQEKGTSVVLVIGPEGIGKTSLINVLGSSLESSDEPFLWIDPNSLKSEEDLLKYPQLLSHSIQTNTPLLKGKVDQAAQELGREAFRLEAMATQMAVGTQENADPLPDLAESWGRIMKEKLLIPHKDQEGKETSTPRVLILLEDFQTFNKSQQLWIKEHLIENLSDGASSPLSYVVTTTPEEAENTRNFFHKDKFSTHSIELSPFTAAELEDLLLRVSLPEIDPEVFFKNTEGFPERIKQIAGDLLNRDLEDEVASKVDQFLANKSTEQLEWIKVTVHLPEFNAEGFRLYFDEQKAEEAYNWLGQQGALIQRVDNKLTYVDEMKSSLLQWTRKQNPTKFQTYNQMASQYVKLLRKFNGSRSCEYINHLACLNFFDDADLEHLLGNSAPGYTKFIKDNPQYFETSGRNQRVLPEYFDVVQEYRALLPCSTTEALRQKASEYWTEKSSLLQGEIRTLKQRKTVEESKLQEVRSKIAELDNYLDKDVAKVSDEEKEKVAVEERRKLLDEAKQSEVDRRVKSSRRFHTVINSILIIAGIAFFYFGILAGQMSDPVATKGLQSSPLVPCLFGVALIVAGILRPLRDRITIQTSKLESRLEKKQAKGSKKAAKKKGGKSEDSGENEETTPIQTSTPYPEELTGAETLIMFKRSRIEAKADEIQERVDDLREAVRAIEQTLDEPLVA